MILWQLQFPTQYPTPNRALYYPIEKYLLTAETKELKSSFCERTREEQWISLFHNS